MPTFDLLVRRHKAAVDTCARTPAPSCVVRPADVARAVAERADQNVVVHGWELVSPDVLRFREPCDMLLCVFATLDLELVAWASSLPLLGKLLKQVEAHYVHRLHPYAILDNSSRADVDPVAEHDCAPPTLSHTDNIPTRPELQHYNRLCTSAGIRPGEEEVQMPKSKRLAEIEDVGMPHKEL